MDPAALRGLIYGCKILKQERGGSKKQLLEEEQVTRDFAFSTVVTIKPIKKGDTLTNKNIWVKRPGIGSIKAKHFNSVIGSVATRDIEIDKHLSWDDFTR
jgi:N-acetylneuraminate synthase